MTLEKITIFYNDLPNSVSKIVGELLNEDEVYIFLRTSEKVIRIPVKRIVRTESERDGRMEIRKNTKN